jgi:hypothetical protein
LVSENTIAQQLSYSDPATAYMRLLLEKSGEGSYQQIGNFKVVGTSYLYGPKLAGDIYTPKEKATNIQLSYNTYNQQIEAYQNNSERPIIMKLAEVDSFRLIAARNADFKEDLLFVNATKLDPSKKFFGQVVASGKRFNLYKAYKSELGYVSTNYVQSELRQFDLNFDYYYSDSAKAGLKKLKVTPGGLKKEFNEIADITTFANDEELGTNPEYALRKIFTVLNNK